MAFFTGLLGGGKSQAQQQNAAAGLQIQTSVYGKPIPIVFGTTRIAPNLIWYGNFKATQQSSGGGAGKGGVGGGGGGKGGGGSAQYLYSTSFEMALCEGAVNGIGKVFVDKNVNTMAALGLSLFTGTIAQAPWGYLVGTTPLITETHAIPGSGPYTVTVNQASSFAADAGVTLSTNTTYALSAGAPAANQYQVSLTRAGATYTFNSANANANVTITFSDQLGKHSESVVVPASAPYTINVLAASGSVNDQGVVATGTSLTLVASAPASGQYSVAAGVYTFNSAQHGQTGTFNYYAYTGNGASLGYSGTAYVAAANYQLGNSPQLPNFNFEVIGKYATTTAGGQTQEVLGEQYTLPVNVPNYPSITVAFSSYFISDMGVTDSSGNVFTPVAATPGPNQYSRGGPGTNNSTYYFNAANGGDTINISYLASVVLDADPSLVVADLLSNTQYGAGFPSGRIGSLSIYQAYCVANGLLISPAYTTQTAASSMMDDLAKATNSAFVWSSGALTLVPYGDQAITANGYTYTPPAGALYDLTDDDFLSNTTASGSAASSNSDPVMMVRKRPSDAHNSIKLEWLDRGNAYNPAIIEAKDQAAIIQFGLRQSSVQQFHMFCNGNAARLSVQLQLQREAIRNIYSFTLDQRYVLLDPMDIVSLSDTNLGLNKQLVRITEITENNDGTLSFTAEEYLQGTGSAPAFSFQQGQGFIADYNASPGVANQPVIFEPTAELSEALEVWLAVSGGPLWGGCDVYTSTDGNTYRNVGRITGSSRTGSLLSPLASVTLAATGETIDQTNTLSVDLSESNGQLLSASQVDATSLHTLCYVDGEYVAYQNSALQNSASQYALTYLVRGAYESTLGSHMAGTRFARLDGSVFKIPFTQDFIGTTIYIKLVGFNVYGGGLQTLAGVQPYAYTLQGTALSSPLPNIANLRTSYVASITQLAWDEVIDFRPVLYEIRQGGAWQGAQVLGRVAHPPFNVQGNGTYWVAAYSQPTPGLQVYSQTPQSIAVGGAQIVSNVIATWDESATGWTGTLSGSAGISGGNVITAGAGNILTDPDYLNTPNILFYGGTGNGTYTIPTGHIVNIGRVAPCSVIISWTAIGQHYTDNVLALADYLGQPDILDWAAAANINVYPEIALSQDGSTWGAWQKFSAGSYNAMAFKARMQLQTLDPTVEAELTAFTFAVDVPDRDDHYVNQAIAGGGTTITFMPDGTATPAAFNGGPQGSPTMPHVQVSILNAAAGDLVVISGVTLAHCTIQILNGGVGVARNVNVLVQGY